MQKPKNAGSNKKNCEVRLTTSFSGNLSRFQGTENTLQWIFSASERQKNKTPAILLFLRKLSRLALNKRLLAQIGNPYNLDNFRAKDSLKGTRKLGKLSPEGSLKFNHELCDLRIKRGKHLKIMKQTKGKAPLVQLRKNVSYKFINCQVLK